LLILHGFLEQSAAWDRVARALPERRVVVPDHRGHGLSDHIGPGCTYHFWDYVGDVDAVIDDLGGPVDLVGHSMGGSMAVLVAALLPNKVRKLVLIEGLGPPDGESGLIAQARLALDHRRSPFRHRPVADVPEAVQRMMMANPDLDAETAHLLAERTLKPAPDGWVWTWDPRHRARAPQAFSLRQFLVFLGHIQASTLLIEGARSPYLHLPDLAARRAAVSGAKLLTLDAGHHPHHTCPELLAGHLREHLRA
jgi:pimeloyl-ACP methyl ester carboxylesterase